MLNPFKIFLRKRSLKDPVSWSIIGFLIFILTVLSYLNGQGLGVITGLFGIGSAIAARWFILNPVYPENIATAEPEEDSPLADVEPSEEPVKRNFWPSRC